MDRLKLNRVVYAGVEASVVLAEHVQGPLDGSMERITLRAGQKVCTRHGPADVVMVHGDRIGVVYPYLEDRPTAFLSPREVGLERDDLAEWCS